MNPSVAKQETNQHPDDPSLIDGVNWVSTRTLIQLREQSQTLPLDHSKIMAKQGGAYLSSFKGRGMEFNESRIYQPGDDIRNMDWRVTARTGTAHTKVFQEERERPILLWLDLSKSMMFATQQYYKSVCVANIAALLAWSASSNKDRVGGLIFSGDQHTEIKPAQGKSATLKLIGRISKHSAWHHASVTNQENRTSAVARLRSVAHPGSMIYMLSDFRHMSKSAYSHLANLSRHNDVTLVYISDPFEQHLPKAGQIRLSDGHKQQQIDTRSKNLRQQYQERALDHENELAEFARLHGIHFVPFSTADELLGKARLMFGKHSFRAALK